MSTLQAGLEVDAQCTKCKLLLAHIIIAMDGTQIAKVECKTCHSVHKYRQKKAKKSLTKKSSVKALAFDELISGKDLSRATRYKISTELAQDEIIDHVKFGLGIVTRILSDNKVEVEFSEGPRVLVHKR